MLSITAIQLLNTFLLNLSILHKTTRFMSKNIIKVLDFSFFLGVNNYSVDLKNFCLLNIPN